MRVKEEKEKIKDIERTWYVTSDGKKFLDKSEAEVHAGYLEWSAEVDRLGVQKKDNSYYCRNKKEFDTVLIMLSYKKGLYNWRKQKWTSMEIDECQYSGSGWYCFDTKKILIHHNGV